MSALLFGLICAFFLVSSHQNTEKSCSIKLKASFTLARRRTVNRNGVHGSKENIAAILYFIKDHMGQPEDCWNKSLLMNMTKFELREVSEDRKLQL